MLGGWDIAAKYDRHGDRVIQDKGIYLLFERGKRPDRAAVREFTAANANVSLSFDPADVHLRLVGGSDAVIDRGDVASASGREVSGGWLELLINGLTFDLDGLAPEATSLPPLFEHAFDFSAPERAESFEALRLAPGEHLAGGEGTLPVVRGMIALARDLAHHFENLEAIVWPPACSIVGRRFFESTVTAWLDGGAFPALGLTAFNQAEDGAIQSVGLAHFIGQEIRIEPPLSDDLVAATRLGVRLVNQLVLAGAIEGVEQVIAPDGTRLAMEPTENGKIVRVKIE